MDCSTPGFPVHHQLPEFIQTCPLVSDAIHLSHPLSSPSPPAFNLLQHQGLSNESVLHIRWPNIGVSASTSVLPMNTQDWFPLGLTGLISLLSKGLSRVFSNTTVQKHLVFSTQSSLWSNTHIQHDYWKNHSIDYTDLPDSSIDKESVCDAGDLVLCLGQEYLLEKG